MRIVKLVLSIVGLAVIAWSIHHIGWAPVLEALRRLTWWQLVLVCLPYAVIMAVDTLGWRFAFPRDAPPLHRLFRARLAGAALQPVDAVGSVGGGAGKGWRGGSLSTGFRLGGWLLGAVEASLILFFLGISADLVTATVIEALGAGVRFATFLVPASLGAFESANAAAFEAMGLGAGAGLPFSFVRRARQIPWIAAPLLVLVSMGWLAKRADLQTPVSTATSSSTSP